MSLLDSLSSAFESAWERLSALFSERPVGSLAEPCANCKKVSAKTSQRLAAAQEAIEYAKRKLKHGAGNQLKDLKRTDYNSRFRLQAARDPDAFHIPDEARAIASENRVAQAAATVAKAELAEGGNCGEHAYVVFDYLRRKFPDEKVHVVQKAGFDHAFVVIGDFGSESDGELVVADAWPTHPTPVLWEDHFAYDPDRNNVILHVTSMGDARDYKQEMLDAGMSLNQDGKALTERRLSKEETDDAIARTRRSLWDHRDTSRSQHRYEQ